MDRFRGVPKFYKKPTMKIIIKLILDYYSLKYTVDMSCTYTG